MKAIVFYKNVDFGFLQWICKNSAGHAILATHNMQSILHAFVATDEVNTLLVPISLCTGWAVDFAESKKCIITFLGEGFEDGEIMQAKNRIRVLSLDDNEDITRQQTVANLPTRRVCFFKLKGNKYLTENGIEITTEMLTKFPHQITDMWSLIILD